MSELGQCECEQYADICNDCFNKYLQQAEEPLLIALKEIAKGEGAFNLEPLKHAENTIESMVNIAKKAIETNNTN